MRRDDRSSVDVGRRRLSCAGRRAGRRSALASRDAGIERGHDERSTEHVRVDAVKSGSFADRADPPISGAGVHAPPSRRIRIGPSARSPMARSMVRAARARAELRLAWCLCRRSTGSRSSATGRCCSRRRRHCGPSSCSCRSLSPSSCRPYRVDLERRGDGWDQLPSGRLWTVTVGPPYPFTRSRPSIVTSSMPSGIATPSWVRVKGCSAA